MMMTRRGTLSLSVAAVLTAACMSPSAAAQESPTSFSGPYLGLELAQQNMIAGALVGGVDMLAQSSRTVTLLNGGYRYQFSSGLVLGAEGGIGRTAGDLRLEDAANGLAIDYDNDTQVAYGGMAGFEFGATREALIYIYVSETERDFDVTITGPLGIGHQSDEQGLLRYGLGLERRLTGSINLRASLGSSRADIDGRPTNIDPETKYDIALGLTWQF